MSHDLWASFATSEIARNLAATPANCFAAPPAAATLSAFASRRSARVWPYEDGVVVLEQVAVSHNVAIEFKRQNEGVHGILTALGQSLAYLDKGFSGAILVLPDRYSSHERPGQYIADVLDRIVGNPAIGVFTYQDPDLSAALPFNGRLHLRRTLQVDVRPVAAAGTSGVTETQWIHVREGSSTPNTFFRYLQIAKAVSAGAHFIQPTVPRGLLRAIQRLQPGADPIRYLSNTVPGDILHDSIWRHFWFGFVLTSGVMQIWTMAGALYVVNDIATELLQADDTRPIKFFSGKSNSIKNRIVARLNAGTIGEDEAWELFAKNARARAHSFREDIDSGLEGIGLLDDDGRPTDLGYRFVDACERLGEAGRGVPRSILMAALLKNGSLGALLFYIYRLSEGLFRGNPLAYTKNGVFNQQEYLSWIETQLAENLHVMRKVAARGGVARKPFQAELAIFRKFGLVSGFRTGVGLEVNWPALQEAMNFAI